LVFAWGSKSGYLTFFPFFFNTPWPQQEGKPVTKNIFKVLARSLLISFSFTSSLFLRTLKDPTQREGGAFQQTRTIATNQKFSSWMCLKKKTQKSFCCPLSTARMGTTRKVKNESTRPMLTGVNLIINFLYTKNLMINRSRKSLISLQGRDPFWSILAVNLEGGCGVTTIRNEGLCDGLHNGWAVGLFVA